MHYAVVRDAAFGIGEERCRVRPALGRYAACYRNGGTAGGSKIMSIKRILVPLPGSVDQTGEIDMALSATKALGAHVEALFISQPPPVTRGGVSVSEYGGRTAAVAPNWYAEERDRTVRDARERFARACAAVGIPLLSANDEPAHRWLHPGAKSRGRTWKPPCSGPLLLT